MIINDNCKSVPRGTHLTFAQQLATEARNVPRGTLSWQWPPPLEFAAHSKDRWCAFGNPWWPPPDFRSSVPRGAREDIVTSRVAPTSIVFHVERCWNVVEIFANRFGFSHPARHARCTEFRRCNHRSLRHTLRL